ncbi:SGNH/GDSL hydrolase family protein [Bradyrhizobium paxllaeri]|uniref:SGNH/GDSL hydrolase family protein n=1 Tax=Bradyrhizobium paxllaeri TaxID=190148 RepID=UPI000810A82D|nr:GDSL-type esterase/lipase family protein [Bradyrhizobium paxllaeri]
MSPLGIGLGAGITERPHRRGGVVSLPKLPLSARWIAEGDSITAGSSGPQWSWQAIVATRGRLFNPQNWNQAVGGQTAAQMATQIAATMAPLPKLVTFLAGTNDLAGSSDTPATIYANILACVKGYLDGGASYVVVSRVLPRNDATWLALSTARRNDLPILNGLIAGLPTDPVLLAAGYAGRVKLATDLTSTFNPATDCVDSLHPNWLGAIKLGNAFADAINACVDQTATLTDLYLDASNLLVGTAKNPALTGTTGALNGTTTPTGVAANAWTLTDNDTMNVVGSKSALNGAEAQRVVVSGNVGTAGRLVNFQIPTVAYSGVAGDMVEASIDFSLAAGYQNLRSFYMACDTASSPNQTTTFLMDGAGAISGTMRTAITTPLAGADTATAIQNVLTFAAGAVAADITFSRPYLRKVPAGQ